MKQQIEHHDPAAFGEVGRFDAIHLEAEELKRLRQLLHEMANVFTGILVTSGLLHHALEGDLRQRYTAEIGTGGDRGATLVREAREILLPPSERMHDGKRLIGREP